MLEALRDGDPCHATGRLVEKELTNASREFAVTFWDHQDDPWPTHLALPSWAPAVSIHSDHDLGYLLGSRVKLNGVWRTGGTIAVLEIERTRAVEPRIASRKRDPRPSVEGGIPDNSEELFRSGAVLWQGNHGLNSHHVVCSRDVDVVEIQASHDRRCPRRGCMVSQSAWTAQEVTDAFEVIEDLGSAVYSAGLGFDEKTDDLVINVHLLFATLETAARLDYESGLLRVAQLVSHT